MNLFLLKDFCKVFKLLIDIALLLSKIKYKISVSINSKPYLNLLSIQFNIKYTHMYDIYTVMYT